MSSSLLATHEITLSDYEALLHLSWSPNGLRRGELAERVHLTAGGITHLLRGLEEAGLVESIRDRDDRRVVVTRLTRPGRNRLRAAARTHVDDIDALFTSRFSDDELIELAELLQSVGDGNEGPRSRESQ